MQFMFRPLLRPGKRALTHLLRHSPFSSAVIGPPKGYYSSTEDWSKHYNKTSDGQRCKYIELLPSELVNRELPWTIEPNVHWKFLPLLTQLHAPCFCTVIAHGRVWGRTGTVITPDDQVLGDVSRESAVPAKTHSALLRVRLGPVRKLKGRVAVLSTVWSDVYFHWMFDVLPRVGLLRMAGLFDCVDTFIVPPFTLPFQRDALERLGIKSDRLIVAHDQWRFHVSAEELIVTSLPSALDTPRAWSCAFLKEVFGCPASPAQGRRRLYISRAKARGRRIVNEAEVQVLLCSLGFESVELEGLSLAEQALLFGSAEIVVAPHGAGLTNIVFCPVGTVVIDLFAPTYVNPCYWVVSQACGLRYSYLIGEGAPPRDGVDPDRKSDDITVDLSALRRLLVKCDCE